MYVYIGTYICCRIQGHQRIRERDVIFVVVFHTVNQQPNAIL